MWRTVADLRAVSFPCAKGWDPVTGVGTANFAVLKNLV